MTSGVERTSAKPTLTFDEKKAAEAAFRGLPIDPMWSLGAQSIYLGILSRTQGRNIVEEKMLEAPSSKQSPLKSPEPSSVSSFAEAGRHATAYSDLQLSLTNAGPASSPPAPPAMQQQTDT